VKAVKGVKFAYQPTLHTRELLSTFKDMTNDAIRICLADSIKGRLKLRDRIYMEFRERYGLVSCFAYSVAEVAWSIVKKHKHWQRKPYAKRLMFKMDAASFSLNYSIVNHYRLFEGGSNCRTVEEGRLRPQREVNRWERRDKV